MPPPKCCYFQCRNNAKDKSMFRFPVRDSSRLEIWLSRCGNMAITHLSHDELRNRYLCVDHFEVKYIRNTRGQRTRISGSAVPKDCRTDPLEITTHSPSSCASQAFVSSPELKDVRPEKTYIRIKEVRELLEDPLECAQVVFSTSKKRMSQDEDTPDKKQKTNTSNASTVSAHSSTYEYVHINSSWDIKPVIKTTTSDADAVPSPPCTYADVDSPSDIKPIILNAFAAVPTTFSTDEDANRKSPMDIKPCIDDLQPDGTTGCVPARRYKSTAHMATRTLPPIIVPPGDPEYLGLRSKVEKLERKLLQSQTLAKNRYRALKRLRQRCTRLQKANLKLTVSNDP